MFSNQHSGKRKKRKNLSLKDKYLYGKTFWKINALKILVCFYYVSDEEWAFVAPYLTLMNEEAPQREHCLREVFNALRWMVRTGAPRRFLPSDLPPWQAVYQQSQRWIKASVFEAMVSDLREISTIVRAHACSSGAQKNTGSNL